MAGFQDHLLEQYSDAELAYFIRASPTVQGYGGVHILSEAYIAKEYWYFSAEDAVAAMELAASMGVRTPRVRRTLVEDRSTYCIMDRIAGPSLEEQWPSIGWLQTLRLAFQLRGIVQTLRSVTSRTAGAFVTGRCRSYWLDDRFRLPPRATIDNIQAFVSFWMEFVNFRVEIQKSDAEHRQPPKQHHLAPIDTLVFTHHDLAARNLILHPSGKLWLVDWDLAGWYPRCFEYASMHYGIRPKHWDRWAFRRWNVFCWVAGGFYDRDEQVLGIVSSKFTRFKVGRRFNIKAGGFASVSETKERERSESSSS